MKKEEKSSLTPTNTENHHEVDEVFVDENDEEVRFPINLHLLILIAILVIVAVGVFLLIRWNRGEISDFDPTYVTDEFDVEPLDFIVPPLSTADYGERLNILCLGNQPFSDETGANGLAAKIADVTGGVVYNGAIPGSTIATKREVTKPHEFFSLFYVTMALVNDDFAQLISRANESGNPKTVAAVDTLASMNMDEVDVIIIMYDTTDYNLSSPADNPNDSRDISAYTGSLNVALTSLQEFFPHVRIIVMSHTFAWYRDEEGIYHNGTITDLGNGSLVHYLLMQYDVAFNTRVTFIDNYFGTINEDNYGNYLHDHMHLNDAGRLRLAERVAAVIK
jgi:hypothetical protein